MARRALRTNVAVLELVLRPACSFLSPCTKEDKEKTRKLSLCLVCVFPWHTGAAWIPGELDPGAPSFSVRWRAPWTRQARIGLQWIGLHWAVRCSALFLLILNLQRARVLTFLVKLKFFELYVATSRRGKPACLKISAGRRCNSLLPAPHNTPASLRHPSNGHVRLLFWWN